MLAYRASIGLLAIACMHKCGLLLTAVMGPKPHAKCQKYFKHKVCSTCVCGRFLSSFTLENRAEHASLSKIGAATPSCHCTTTRATPLPKRTLQVTHISTPHTFDNPLPRWRGHCDYSTTHTNTTTQQQTTLKQLSLVTHFLLQCAFCHNRPSKQQFRLTRSTTRDN